MIQYHTLDILEITQHFPALLKTMRQWEVQGCRIVIITGRRESERVRTEKDLRYHNIPYDMLIMGFADTGRVLINDVGGKGECKARCSITFQGIRGLKNLIGKK